MGSDLELSSYLGWFGLDWDYLEVGRHMAIAAGWHWGSLSGTGTEGDWGWGRPEVPI